MKGAVFMMFLWIPILVFIIIHFLKDQNKSMYSYNKRTPLEILDEKFINGELSEEEYKRKRSLLNR